jgi:subtilase family serine protease
MVMKIQRFVRSTLILSSLCLLAAVVFAARSASAQLPVRIAAEISSSQHVALPGSLRPQARAENDRGRLPGSTRLQGVTMEFSRTAAQEARLQSLIAAQQNPSSPHYHQWLNPDEFAAQFGLRQSDLDKVTSWLEQQGFSIDSVNRSRNAIHFSGTAAQVEQAFATEMHIYAVGSEKHFAPSTVLSVPAALAPVVQGIRNLDDFRPKPKLILNRKGRLKPAFTQAGTEYLFFAPGDIDLQYDLSKEYSSGYNGAGQSITVIGQSLVTVADIEAFQNAANLPVKDPTLVLVPNTGTASYSSGDEAESDIDLGVRASRWFT